jgi:trimeric autotransporter adhesin
VVFFATGEGQTMPPGVDGKPSPSPYPTPALPVSVTIGGVPAGVQFAGSAPGFAGLLQINAQVPTSVAPGNSVPVAIAIGDKTSQPGITIAVN